MEIFSTDNAENYPKTKDELPTIRAESEDIMNINDIVAGMTPQEKEAYFAHMERRHREEAEKLEAEKERRKEYKQSLIEDILKRKPNFPLDELQRMTTRTLERIVY